MPVPDGIGHDRLFPAVALQLATMLVAGGTARPFNALLCLLASLPTLYLLLSGTRTRRPGWVAATALALFAVAWLQLVPLPPAAWTALPGRDLAAKALAVAGLGPGWRPVALDPQAALSALISLVSPLVLLVAAARLSGTEQRSMLKAILAFALASAFLGLAQRLTGTFTPYDIDHAGYATGLFANRNHLAALLACALVLLPALFAPSRRRADILLVTAMGIVLVAGIVATTSRAGLALAVLALLAMPVIYRPDWRWLTGGAIALALAVLALLQVPALAPVFDRFALIGGDQRLTMAATSWKAAEAFFPWGSGWGSFVPVYMACYCEIYG